MKQCLKLAVLFLLIVSASSLYAFKISNNTQKDFELSVMIKSSYTTGPALIDKKIFLVGETIEISYDETIIFPSHQLVVKLFYSNGFIPHEYTLTFPNLYGTTIRPSDELGVFPQGDSFKIVRIGTPR